MYTLIEIIKETATSIFFQGEHMENETFHTIEIQKETIQDYLYSCDRNFIPQYMLDNIMQHDNLLDNITDICQDIVKFGSSESEFFVLKSEKSTKSPKWGAKCWIELREPKSGIFTLTRGENYIHDCLKRGDMYAACVPLYNNKNVPQTA
jgi:hypothetical protein